MSWNIGLFLFDGLWVKAPGSTLGTQHVWLVIFQLNLIEPKKCILLRKFHQINCALKNWWKKFYESFPSCELFPSLCVSKILNENVHCRPSMMSQKIPRCLTASEGLFQASLNWKEPSKTGLIKVNQNSLFRVRNLETWKMKYLVGLETGNWKIGFQTWDSMHISMSVLTYFSAIADC